MYTATVGTIDDPHVRLAMDGVLRWFAYAKADALAAKPSLHVFTEEFPPEQRDAVDAIRRDATIRAHSGEDCPIALVPDMDELYLTHVQHDGGDKGLSYDHYDGPLRF